MRRLKRCVLGCEMVSAVLILCIPAMAGGFSAKSDLKVNVIGFHPCTEQGWTNELCLLEEEQKQPEDKLLKATPSNVTKSNAIKSNVMKSNVTENNATKSNATKSNAKMQEM